MGEDNALTVTDEDKWRLHKGCIHDDIVRVALAGFLCAHFDQHGIEIDPRIFDDCLKMFSAAMSRPDVVNQAAEKVVVLQAARAAEQAERRKGMH